MKTLSPSLLAYDNLHHCSQEVSPPLVVATVEIDVDGSRLQFVEWQHTFEPVEFTHHTWIKAHNILQTSINIQKDTQ